MAVSLFVHGRLAAADRIPAVLAFARERAAELEWEATEIEHRFEAAEVRSRLGSRTVRPFRARGLSLRPHFACDPLGLVFAGDPPETVDLYIHEGDDGRKTVDAGSLLNTQFAGVEVHQEICEFLDELAKMGVELTVDDETGFFETRDGVALRLAFDRAWDAVRRRLEEDAPAAGEPYSVGEFAFEAGPRATAGEFERVDQETADRLLGLEAETAAAFTGLGYVLDRSRDSVADLELAADDLAQEATTEETEREREANALGAAFGRTLVAQLGGHWRIDEDEGLRLHDVGGVGLIVDPILVAWRRLTVGPVHALTHHYRAYEALVRGLSEGRRPT
ncbi:MAG TPA: hypothetical protein VEI02_14125 [Planctomycetota bacterium]|nr:hypothetical protein [Planctomycetota bacterium]